ncbi:MAG: Na+/H+ antiporter subunit E [Verrucomicrobia bacterium]|nr:Na+/H+ antiporter subunit E [Verrucomicrobiota bacterium]MCH8528627.1 Na+/H+ antiporter subunit E [Kiritimatiellia bacterium]
MPPAEPSTAPPPSAPRKLPRAIFTFAFGLVLWKVCTGYDPESWVLGIPAAGLFTYFVITGAEDGPRIRFRALPGFLVYFLVQSFRTGIDVARHAILTGHQVNPGFTQYRSRLPEGSPRAVFANMISLLPGTLSWSLIDDIHKIHMLEGNPLAYEELAELEARVGKLYGIDLPELPS